MKRPSPPLSFLVVEDETILAMDLSSMIEDAGHQVVAEAASLREVKALHRGASPHVAFVDLQLAEGSSGLDVCAFIRERWASAIVVFVTANPGHIQTHHGAHGVIAKPFSRNSLMSAMRYIAEGICDPPPSSPHPVDFKSFPRLSESWA
jgi:CheY-like chemotaxis protein